MKTRKRHRKNCQRAFVDTNVLAQIVGDSDFGSSIAKTLRKSNFEIVTFSKCVYELYSLIKGTTKDGSGKKNHPLANFLQPEINDIAQRLFKKSPDIDTTGNSYYWFNLSEEWRGWDYFENMEGKIESLVADLDHDEVLIFQENQKKFAAWKAGVLSAFNAIDNAIKIQGIHVCEYFQIYSSDWYKKYGFFYERELAKNSLLPNEDFEIVMAALFLEARVFISQDDKGFVWRGGLSFGHNMPQLSFCCPEKIEEAIGDDFTYRFYSKQ
jgi:hypothetical protein